MAKTKKPEFGAVNAYEKSGANKRRPLSPLSAPSPTILSNAPPLLKEPKVSGHVRVKNQHLRNFGVAGRKAAPGKPSPTMITQGENSAPLVKESGVGGAGDAYARLLDERLPEEAPPACGLTLASFFCCGGGIDLGFRSAGFRTVFANDIHQAAADTFEANLGHKPLLRTIREVGPPDYPVGSPDVVTGGFPCVTFSMAGRRAGVTDDENGKLYLELCRVITELNPRYFVAENVKGMLSANGGQAVKLVLAAFLRLGYRTSYELVNMADHGVPQARERVIFVGVRVDQWRGSFRFPKRTHRRVDDKGATRWLPRARSLRDAIGDLPAPAGSRIEAATGGENGYIVRAENGYIVRAESESRSISTRKGQRLRSADEPSPVPTSVHPPHVLVRDQLKGQMYGDAVILNKDGTHRHKQSNYVHPGAKGADRPALAQVSTAGNILVVGVRNKDFANKFRRATDPSPAVVSSEPPELATRAYADAAHVPNDAPVSSNYASSNPLARGSKPSPTIVSEAVNVQPFVDGLRRMTARECARVQSFPDWYEFKGSQADHYRIIGNAVPPLYARALAEAILEYDARPL